QALLERACALCGGEAIVVTTLQHAGTERFVWPNTLAFTGLDLTNITAQTMREGSVSRHDVVAYRLDVDGQELGCAVLLLTPDTSPEQALERLGIWSEQVDNYLAAQVEAQRKQAALREL